MDVNYYRTLADKIGGDDGQDIHKLITAYEQALKVRLLGNQEVAHMLGIDPKNMHHKRRTKYFPNPVLQAGKFPFWLERDIREYIEHIDEWRKNGKE